MPGMIKAKTVPTHKAKNDLPAQKRADVVAILNHIAALSAALAAY